MSEVMQTEESVIKTRMDDKNSINYAVSRLLKEPKAEEASPPEEEQVEAEAAEVSLEVEPEETEEETEVEEDAEATAENDTEETEESDSQTYEVEEEEAEVAEYYTIKVDGEELEVTMDELRSGYQRQSDYTKKTQSLADERKELTSKTQELEKLHTQYMTQATLANELLNRDLKKYDAINWDTLKQEDPVGYVQKQLEVQGLKQQQQELFQQAQQATQHAQQAQAEEHGKVLQQEGEKMLEVFPHWKDPEVKQEEQGKIVQFAKQAGYAEEELATIYRARDLLMLDQARKYSEISKSKEGIPKKVKPAVRKVIKPKGIAPKKTVKKKRANEAKARLKKSGSLKDAAAYMHQLRN